MGKLDSAVNSTKTDDLFYQQQQKNNLLHLQHARTEKMFHFFMSTI